MAARVKKPFIIFDGSALLRVLSAGFANGIVSMGI